MALIVITKHYKLTKNSGTPITIPTSNRNTLLRTDDSVDGLNRLYHEAGYGLVASALRDDMRLVSVVLGSATRRTRASESEFIELWHGSFRRCAPCRVTSLRRATSLEGRSDTFVAGALESIALTVSRGGDRSRCFERLEAPISRVILLA